MRAKLSAPCKGRPAVSFSIGDPWALRAGPEGRTTKTVVSLVERAEAEICAAAKKKGGALAPPFSQRDFLGCGVSGESGSPNNDDGDDVHPMGDPDYSVASFLPIAMNGGCWNDMGYEWYGGV
jgi:hypothetical protein